MSLEQIQSIRLSPIASADGRWTFSINNPRRGYVRIEATDTGATFGAVALYDAVIDRARAHPDGLLVLTAGQIGKITRNDKGAWTYGPCNRTDLDLAGVSDTEEWEAAAGSLRVYGHLFEGVQEALTDRLEERRKAAARPAGELVTLRPSTQRTTTERSQDVHAPEAGEPGT